MKKRELVELIKLNREIENEKRVLSFICEKNKINFKMCEPEEKEWFPKIHELKKEFKVLKQEIYETKEKLKVKEKERDNRTFNCQHQIVKEKIYNFWGELSIDHNCIFCGKELTNNSDDEMAERNVIFKTYYDEYGDVMTPEYTLPLIYEILENILDKYEDDEEVDLVKEIESLKLRNVVIGGEENKKLVR